MNKSSPRPYTSRPRASGAFIAILAGAALILAASLWWRWAEHLPTGLPDQPHGLGSAETPAGSTAAGSSGGSGEHERVRLIPDKVTDSDSSASHLNQFTGRILVARRGGHVPLRQDATIRIAEASAVTRDRKFKHFVIGQNGGGRPIALDGELFQAKEGEWSMPIPAKLMDVISVNIGGKAWRVASGGLIEPRATTADFVVEPQRTCVLEVFDLERKEPLTGVAVMEVPMIPANIQVVITIPKISGSSNSVQHPKEEFLREAATPPLSAQPVSTDASSPIRFSARSYDRAIWVGKEGRQWRRLEWPATRHKGEALLGPAQNLDIHVIGMLGRRGCVMQLRQPGSDSIRWKLKVDGRYQVTGLSAGHYHLEVRQSTGGGRVSLASKVVEVALGADRYETVDLSMSKAHGSVVVYVSGLQELETDGYLSICPKKDINFGLSCARSTLLQRGNYPSGDAEIGFRGVPAGDYVLCLMPIGVVSIVSVTPGQQSSVHMSMDGAKHVVVKSRSGGKKWPQQQLQWMPVLRDGDGSSHVINMALCSLPRPGQWRDGVWRFATVADEIICRVRADGGDVLESRVLRLKTGKNEFDLNSQAIVPDLIQLVVHDVPGELRYGMSRDILNVLKVNGAPEYPVLMDVAYGDSSAERVSVVLKLAVPPNSSWTINSDRARILGVSFAESAGTTSGSSKSVVVEGIHN